MSSAAWALTNTLLTSLIKLINFSPMKTQFKVTGMTCESCKSIIEDIAKDFPEVKKCEVNLEAGTGNIEYQDSFDINKFKAEINSLGKYVIEFIN